MRIVVVEDETVALCSLVKLIGQISEHHHVVGEARDGLEAEAVILGTHPDVVLTDIRMPGKNGLDLIEGLVRAKCAATFIIISGYADFEYARKAIHLGVQEYLVKPFTLQDVAGVLATVEARRSRSYQLADEAATAGAPLLPQVESTHPHVVRALQIIRDNMEKPCSLSDVSGLVGISPEHLSRLFHAEVGLKFSQYVTLAKIDYAMSLIRNSQYKMQEIAWLCGYQNIKYFYRVFKETTGMSTGEYRQLQVSQR